MKINDIFKAIATCFESSKRLPPFIPNRIKTADYVIALAVDNLLSGDRRLLFFWESNGEHFFEEGNFFKGKFVPLRIVSMEASLFSKLRRQMNTFDASSFSDFDSDTMDGSSITVYWGTSQKIKEVHIHEPSPGSLHEAFVSLLLNSIP